MSELLESAKKKIEASVPAKLKKVYDAIVTNGMKLMWSDQTHGTLKTYVKGAVRSEKDVPGTIAKAIRGAIRMILNASKTKPDMNEPFYAASFPAAYVLMCDALAYVEKVKGITISNDILAETTQAVTAELNEFYGITSEHMKAGLEHAKTKRAGA